MPIRRIAKDPAHPISIPLFTVTMLVGIFLIVPTLVVFPMSFTPTSTFHLVPEGLSLQWYERFFTDPEWIQSFWNSVAVALVVTVVATTIGTLAAIALQRSSSRAVTYWREFLMLPMVAPGIVIAVVVYIAFLRWGLVGTFAGYALIHTAMAIPFVLTAVTASLKVYDSRLTLAATTLGSSPLRAFFRVQMPNIAPGVVSGAVFAFVTSLDEVVVALFIRSPTFQTLPVKMFNSVTIEIDPTVAAASAILVAFATTLIFVPQLIHYIQHRRRTRSS